MTRSIFWSKLRLLDDYHEKGNMCSFPSEVQLAIEGDGLDLHAA